MLQEIDANLEKIVELLGEPLSKSPEEREEIRQLIERGRAAREHMQAILDRRDARKAAEDAKRERRRRLLRRFLSFRRAA